MRNGARTASTRAISYFAFRCYSEIVANRPAWNRWPVRCFPPHLSRFFPVLLGSPSPIHPPDRRSLSALDVLVPAASYPTRCFINENEGASYIFLTRQSRPALVLHPSFFPSWISPFRHYCYHFPRRSHRPDGEYPHNPPRSSPRSLFAVTSTIARGGNITFRIPDRSPGNATTSSAQN